MGISLGLSETTARRWIRILNERKASKGPSARVAEGKRKVQLTYDPTRIGVVVEEGPEVSGVKFNDGVHRFIPNDQLQNVVERRHRVETGLSPSVEVGYFNTDETNQNIGERMKLDLNEQNVFEAEMTVERARQLVDELPDTVPEELTNALDEAQGFSFSGEGDAYVVIKITT